MKKIEAGSRVLGMDASLEVGGRSWKLGYSYFFLLASSVYSGFYTLNPTSNFKEKVRIKRF